LNSVKKSPEPYKDTKQGFFIDNYIPLIFSATLIFNSLFEHQLRIYHSQPSQLFPTGRTGIKA